MRILALDTVTEGCSAALLHRTADGPVEVVERFEELARGHVDRIVGLVDSVLAEGGVGLGGLDAIAVDVGPGAFTGVRISVAVGQGLAYGAGLPVIPITSLEALAMQADGTSIERPIVACLDARMGEVYWGCFRVGEAGDRVALRPLRVSAPSDVILSADGTRMDVALVGRGFAAYPDLTRQLGASISETAARALPRAQHVARLAASRFVQGAAIEARRLTPVYLRDKVAFTEAERARRGAPE